MADVIDFSVDTRDFEKALKALPKKLREVAMQHALQAAGDVMLDPIVALTPERTDEEMPNSNALTPGIAKADIHTEVELKGESPRVKVGPSRIAGYVVRWQNNGYMLTSHGKRSKRNAIRAITGKHFLEAGFDESIEKAIDTFVTVLGDEVFGKEEGDSRPENDDR